MNMDELEDIFDGEQLPNPDENEVIIEDNLTPVNDNFFDEENIDEKPKESLLDTFLKSKGIDNALVSIIDEDGSEKEVNFYDLPQEEQLEILRAQEEVPNENLEDSEIDLINHLRTNNLSVDDFITQIRESVLAEVQQPVETSYSIDAYNDHELFLLDLKNKYELSDIELQAELEKELTNEELFNKKVTKLRAEYKQLEDQDKAAKQAEFEAQQTEQYNQFANNMVSIATNIEDFHGVTLEDSEKQETLSYLLDLDDTGVSKFSKDLNDPTKLYEAAWYLRYGKEAFQALENAYEAEITRLKKEVKKDKPRVVVPNSNKQINTIHDLPL